MSLSESELKDLAQQQATGGPQPGEIYRHYKGGLYTVVCMSIKEDTLELLVTYHSNKKRTIWTRTVANFCEDVNGRPRFQRETD